MFKKLRRKIRKDVKVKPCPFCGAPPKFIIDNHSYRVSCSDDDCFGKYLIDCQFNSLEDACSVWNCRGYEYNGYFELPVNDYDDNPFGFIIKN